MLNGSYFLERFFSAKRIEYVYHMTLENILIKVRKIYVKIHKFHAQWFLVILLHVHVHVSYFFYLRARIRYYANFLFATFCWYICIVIPLGEHIYQHIHTILYANEVRVIAPAPAIPATCIIHKK